MNVKSFKPIILSLLIVIICSISCQTLDPVSLTKFSNNPPVASEIKYNSANITGKFMDVGDGLISYGHCWSNTQNPVITGFKTINSGTPEKQVEFISQLTGLSSDTKYYVRAYAELNGNTIYSKEINFTTLAPPITVITATLSAISNITATCGGNITAEAGNTITDRGVCWDIANGPTIELSTKTSNGTGTGIFISNITGLAASTKYYVRAYAIGSSGVVYGNEIAFTTSVTAIVLPTLTTVAITSITQTTATGGGNISIDGGAAVSGRGVCYGTATNPTIANSVTINGTGTGTYVSPIAGLTPNTTYYLRAYAINTIGTAYGNEISFTTSAASTVIPTLSTTSITALTQTTASSGGNITSDGGSVVTGRGVCYGTAANPTIMNNVTVNGAGVGLFTSSIAELAANTTYYLRAYAINSAGAAYGNEISFTTNPVTPVVPTLATTSITSITTTTASSGGNITSDGGATITARGICWGTSTNPTIDLTSKTSDGAGVGSFTSSLSGLIANTTYYVRAYATNSLGTAYGNEVNFTTNLVTPVLPTLTTTSITSITTTTAISGGYITSDGGATVTSRGICWSTTANPTIANTKSSDGYGKGGYISNISGLTALTTYYVRSYATNNAGTAYGNEVVFTSLAPVIIPSIITSTISNIAQTNVTGGGNVTSDGGGTITERGLCYSTNQNPTTNNSKVIAAGTIGIFTLNISNLSASTSYFIRAYATNSAGTAYGNEISFTTNALEIPKLSTMDMTAVTATTSNSGGNISSDGGTSVIARGVCWNTAANPGIELSTKTTDGLGSGSFKSTISGLANNTKYYLRAYATNSQGTGYGNEITFTTTSLVYDLDGNAYNTVIIGTQVWIVKNLYTTKYNDGATIPNVTDNTAWSELTTGAFCWPNNDVALYNTYGSMYNWYAVNMGKLCPTGWHVPTDLEWGILIDYLGGDILASGKIRESGTTHWAETFPEITNETGFKALPGGVRTPEGLFITSPVNYGHWWSSTSDDLIRAYGRGIASNNSPVLRGYDPIAAGFFIRCVKN